MLNLPRWKEKVVQPPTPTHEELLALDAEVAQHPNINLFIELNHQLHQHHQQGQYSNHHQRQHFHCICVAGGGEPENENPHPGFKERFKPPLNIYNNKQKILKKS